MKFTESVRICLIKKPFTFSGRGSRSEYWWFYLFVLISSFALQLLGNIGSIISFVITIPQFAASVRRLHDSNLSGWFIFVPITLLILTFLLAYKKAFVAGTIFFVICWYYISISIIDM